MVHILKIGKLEEFLKLDGIFLVFRVVTTYQTVPIEQWKLLHTCTFSNIVQKKYKIKFQKDVFK